MPSPEGQPLTETEEAIWNRIVEAEANSTPIILRIKHVMDSMTRLSFEIRRNRDDGALSDSEYLRANEFFDSLCVEGNGNAVRLLEQLPYEPLDKGQGGLLKLEFPNVEEQHG